MRNMFAMNLRLRLATVLALVLMAFPARAQDVILKKLTVEANDFYRQAKYVDAVRVQQDARRSPRRPMVSRIAKWRRR